MASRARRVLVAAFLAAAVAVPLVVIGPSAGAGKGQAGVVVIHDDGSSETDCVTFRGKSASTIELLTASRFSFYSTSHPDYGRSICWLDGEGVAPPGCFGGFGDPYWQLFLQRQRRSQVQEGLGASVDRVRDTGIVYIKFDNAFPAEIPDKVPFGSVCGK